MSYVAILTFLHTALSLIAIPFGIMAVRRLFDPGLPAFWTRWFLWLAFITSATGFLFPFGGVTPAIVAGVLALVILAAVLYARPRQHEATLWRWVFAGGIVASLWLDVFVLIVQMFLKIPVLHQFAPTGTEPAFGIAQLIVLAAFVWIGIVALKSYRPQTVSVPRSS